MRKISYYPKLTGDLNQSVLSKESLTFEKYLEKVKGGEWKNIVEMVRNEKDATKQKELKKLAPGVTASGLFSKRSASNLTAHSGIICIDIDAQDQSSDFDVEVEQAGFEDDTYVVAVHKSIRGAGLAVYFAVETSNRVSDDHKKAFLNLCAYVESEYNLVPDRATGDISRVRYISYDPDLYYNPNYDVFDQLDLHEETDRSKGRRLNGRSGGLTAASAPRKKMYTFEQIKKACKTLTEKDPEILADYGDWQKMSFALADEFDEKGRELFHILSESASNYDESAADDKYDNALTSSKGQGVSIGTLYYMFAENDVKVVDTDRDSYIRASITSAAQRGEDPADIARNINEDMGEAVDEEEVLRLVGKVDEETKISRKDIYELLKAKLKKYKFRFNEVTRNQECNFMPNKKAPIPYEVTDYKMGKLLGWTREKIHYSITKQLLWEVSEEVTKRYHPIWNFIEENEDYPYNNEIEEAMDCIELMPNVNREHTMLFIRKWMLSMMGNIHGVINPLFLILSGGQGSGKTTFFRFFLPDDLQTYYAEGDHGLDRDNLMKMADNLMLVNDEMTDSYKADWRERKKATSIDIIKERAAYARKSESRKRLALFGGSTNDIEFLADLTGNRRFIPVNMKKLDWERYRAIDKTALFMGLYREYLKDPRFMFLTKEEIDMLNNDSEHNQVALTEEELVQEFFELPEDVDEKYHVEATNTQILKIISEGHSIKLSAKKLGMVLVKMGFERKRVKRGGSSKQVYLIGDKRSLIRKGGMR